MNQIFYKIYVISPNKSNYSKNMQILIFIIVNKN